MPPPAGLESDTTARTALYIDAENLIIEAQKQGLPVNIKLIMDRVREDGLLSVARAYADWTAANDGVHPYLPGQRTLRPGRRPSLPLPPELESRGRFDSDTDALKFYRDALANKRVPLVQWSQRRRLLSALWERLEDEMRQNGPGLTLAEMTDVLTDAAGGMFFNLPRMALEKLAYTGIIARAVHLQNPQEADLRQRRYWPDCPIEEALIRINTAYVRGIRMDYPDVVLMRRPLALLLFDTDSGDALVDIEGIMERVQR